MLWELKRTISVRRFFLAPKSNDKKIFTILCSKFLFTFASILWSSVNQGLDKSSNGIDIFLQILFVYFCRSLLNACDETIPMSKKLSWSFFFKKVERTFVS